jgi:hypothetical protein
VIAFATQTAAAASAQDAAREATANALASLDGAQPALAIVFASRSYDDLHRVPAAVDAELRGVPLAGGTVGGALFNGSGVHQRGVLVALLGGDGVVAMTATAPITSAEMQEVVPAAALVASGADRAARAGFEEALCLTFAPAARVDGEALVAAVRKGTGARMQLAGALMGGATPLDRPRVFAREGELSDHVVLAGVFTRSPVGVAARHGWQPKASPRVVTRSDGVWLVELDGKPALEHLLNDISRAHGRQVGAEDLLVSPTNRYVLGLEVSSHVEPLLRCPMAIRSDGSVRLAASLPEGTRVSVMHADAAAMLEAAHWAGSLAHERAGGQPIGGLVLTCQKRLVGLEDRFPQEPAAIARALGAPVAGACIFGEIARGRREIDAFHNMTAVVVAWPRDGKSPPGSSRVPLRAC